MDTTQIANQEKVGELEYLGQDFQFKAAKALIEDKELYKSVYKIVDHNAFGDVAIRRILGTEKALYNANKTVPSYYEILTKLKYSEKNPTELECLEETINKIKETSAEGQNFTEQTLIDYMKWKYVTLNINRFKEKLLDGYDGETFGKFMKEMNKILNMGVENYSEIRFTKDNLIRMLREGDDEVIPTGIYEVDSRLAGGVGRTELALFTALTGFGKTTFASVLAFNAATRGFKVLQIYFEDKDTNMLRKDSAMIVNCRINELKGADENTANALAERLSKTTEISMLEENLRLLKMAEKNTTVEDIENEIDRRINEEGFRPDLIIIDYFSCLKFSRNAYKDVWAAQSDCMRKIKAMADKYNLAVWVMQQNNRPSPEKTAGMGNWQGAYEATQPASVWIELQRTAEQKQNGKADLIFNKTRNSQPKDDLYDIVFDNSRMIIDCSPAVQNEEDLIYKEN